ncbi:MAG: hypothetical protein IPL89_07105 [Acidobacteria bacterium]|nr:hypothetical protein [Acidobacteriota bacterium]
MAPSPPTSLTSTASAASVAFVRIRLVRKAPSSRTARIERSVPFRIRSAAVAAGTLCPNVPPKPGVDVWPSTATSALSDAGNCDATRIAP